MATPSASSASIDALRSGAEPRFVLSGVPWWTYVALRDALEHTSVRMTYLKGALELMGPSEMHEESKTIIGRLLEVWAEENDVDLRGFGSATYRSEAEERGHEPDECYALGPKVHDAVPHLAIEVVVGSPLLDKLAVYAGLAVREVWVWRASDRVIEVHGLAGRTYEPRQKSELLPDVDLVLLSRFVRPGESHTALARAYRAAIARH